MHPEHIKAAACETMKILNASATAQQFNALCEVIQNAALSHAKASESNWIRSKNGGWE